MTKRKGEVKVSVKGNPFSYNENPYNFGVNKQDIIHVDWDLTELLAIIKKLQGK